MSLGDERPVPMQRSLGVGRGKVFPAARARSLLSPLRRIVQPPSRTVGRIGLAASDRVLEIGCGPAYFTPELVRSVPRGRVVAFDLQLAMLKLAVKRADRSVDFVQGDATALPFKDASFDAALVILVLGEVSDRARCLAELARVVRNGGQVALCESRRDSDFIGLSDLVAQVESHGFSFVGRRGFAWEYMARFSRV
ncbi:MAG: class I SAM-dependent methyltransferase [Acidimicrobiales bacterium]